MTDLFCENRCALLHWKCIGAGMAIETMRLHFLPNGMSLSAFLWARRLEKSLPARHREAVAEQDSKLVHGRFPVEGS
ncbi:hypothetical protein, partial [Ralstonia solanacearum]|uniref:hypothetical protein n=1 Tax=Ralstonia solanacearum TaxID=305 RepID=UPI001E62B0F9